MNGEHLVGKILGGRYEILEVIGNGGMATVYKARCQLLNRFVAIKVLKASLSSDEDILKRFKSESESTAKLSHHNIVGVYDVGEENGINYIVMELVDGITLKEYISSKGVLDWKEACEIASQIGLALQCAHDSGVVHRDIKPHNILLTKDHTVKVADFGIARAVSSDTMVTSKETMGSVRYISPEQARGGYIDGRSDIYSLGVVLYEMLTGTVPFDGENPVSIAMLKLNEAPADIRILNPELPTDIAEITMRAISKEQHVRYQNAVDLVSDLKEVMDGGISYSGSGSYKGRKEARMERGRKTNSKLILVLGAVALAIVLGFLVRVFMSGGTQQVQVPEVIGMTLEEAVEYVAEFGIEIDEESIEYESSDEYEDGFIMLQEPGINQYMNPKKKIKVTVSTGAEEASIPVPNVTELKYEDAVKELEKLGLKAERIDEPHDTVEVGYVIKQTPHAKVKVTENSTILLHVSEGKKAAKDVPELVGESLSTAQKLINALELEISVTEREDAENVGKVISQSPLAGEKILPGEVIKVVVGIEPAIAPSPTPSDKPTRKTLTIQIPDTAGETVQIKVVANGRPIYEKTHQKAEGTVDIPVEARNDATVQVYMDGEFMFEKVIEF